MKHTKQTDYHYRERLPFVLSCKRCGHFITDDEWNHQTNQCRYCPDRRKDVSELLDMYRKIFK